MTEPNILEQIDAVSQDFRRAWKAGARPSIEQFLTLVPDNGQANLFRNLLDIEIKRRYRAKEAPSSSEYVQRFPKFVSQIRQVFDESTMGSMEGMANRDAENSSFDEPTMTIGAPSAGHLGEYELICELGRGGFGVVYEARHSKRGNRVALKTLPTGVDGQEINAERLHKFRREFRSLSEINHPNLVGMQTLEVDGDQWFFTMDLIEGEDFLSHVRPNDALDETRLRSSLAQLAKGIIALHELRIVHRDLKPSNVMVEKDGTVKILDFGLVAQLQTATDQTASLRSAQFAGTPRYAAPEQMFGNRSEASDWYALGTMLYEALTGSPPFTGKPMEILQKKQNQDPPTLLDGEAAENVPTDLAGLVDGLLKREPGQRPNTSQIVDHLQLDSETRAYGSTAGLNGSSGSVDDVQQDWPNSDEEIILVGREEQLAQLEAAKQELLAKREPIVVWITGKSGEGKSSLAEKFLRPIQRGKKMLVLSGRCYDRENIPYKAIDSLIENLVSYLRSQDSETLRDWLPDDIQMLSHIFPLLNRVEAIGARSENFVHGIDDRQIRFRAVAALRELIKNICQTTPVIMSIDDLQWGDADSAVVLNELLVPPDPPPVMLIGSYRDDEADESDFLKTWNSAADIDLIQHFIKVGILDEAQCASLLEMKLGPDYAGADDRAREFYSSTHGNPYFIGQLLDAYHRAPEGLAADQLLGDVVGGKLSRLPDAAKDVLDTIAIAGRAVDADEAIQVAGVSGDDAFGLLARMRNEKLIRMMPSSDRQKLDTYHDKIREETIERLDKSIQTKLHHRYGELIEHQEATNVNDLVSWFEDSLDSPDAELPGVNRANELAFHFSSANDRRGFAYQVMAGEKSFRAYALSESKSDFLRAISLMPEGVSDRLRCRLYERLAFLHAASNEFSQAHDAYDRAICLTDKPRILSRLRLGKGSVFHGQLSLRQSLHQFDESLAVLGINRPRGIRCLPGILWYLARFFVVPDSWKLESKMDRRAHAMKEAAILSRMIQCVQVEGNGFLEVCYVVCRQPDAAFKCGNQSMITSGASILAVLLQMVGLNSLGRRAGSKARNRAKNLDDLGLRAHQLFWNGWFEWVQPNGRAAADKWRECLEVAQRGGITHYIHQAIHSCRIAAADVHPTSAEISLAKTELKLEQVEASAHAKCWGHYGVGNGMARRGNLNEACRHLKLSTQFLMKSMEELSGETHNLSLIVLHRMWGCFYLQSSRYEDASREFLKSWDCVSRLGLKFDQVMRTYPWLIESEIGSDWSQKKVTTIDAKKLRGRMRMAKFMGWMWPNLRPLCLRQCGRILAVLEKRKKAIRYFERSIKFAKRIGYHYDEARSLLDLAAVKNQDQRKNRNQGIELLKQVEAVIPRAESWLLGDQYDEAVVAPEFDLEAWEREHGVISRPAHADFETVSTDGSGRATR